MIEHVVREWWNNKIEQRCYNNHELGCCIKSGFACSNIREQPLSIRQAVYNMLKHDWTILLFYQSCSIMLTVLLQGCRANNPVIAWYFYTCSGAVFKYFFTASHLGWPNSWTQNTMPQTSQDGCQKVKISTHFLELDMTWNTKYYNLAHKYLQKLRVCHYFPLLPFHLQDPGIIKQKKRSLKTVKFRT